MKAVFGLFLVALLAARGLADEPKKDEGDDYLKYAIPKGAKVVEQNARPGHDYVVIELYFVADKRVGARYYWDRDKTKLHSEELFKDERQCGLWRQWHENGKLKSESPFKDGQMHGTFTQFDSSGKLLGSSLLKDGNGTLRTWYPNGRLEYVRPYKNGKQDGELQTFFDSGQLFQMITFKDGQAHGISYIWDREGKPANDSPKFYLQDKRVTKEEYRKAAETDKSLPPIKADDGDR